MSTTENTASQLENALDAVRRGFLVHPCEPRTKAPATRVVRHGVKEATQNEAKIRYWWKINPDFNPAVNAGVVVDCDTGLTSLEQALEWSKNVGLPPTLTVRTGRRPEYGVQFHFAGKAKKNGPYESNGVEGEIRLQSMMYGMAPGAIHPSGERYEIVVDLPIAHWPLESKFEIDALKTINKLKQPLRKIKLGEKIKTSQRQYWLVSQCGRLRNTGLTDDALFIALRSLCDQYCESPQQKTDAMLRQICESGVHNYGVNVPEPTQNCEDNDEFKKMIEEFNEKFFVIRDHGGHAVVGNFEKDITVAHGSSEYLKTRSIHEFRNGYLNEFVQVDGTDNGKTKLVTKANAWLCYPGSKRYERVVFLPNKEVANDVKNLWQKFAFEPKKGNKHVPYLEHVLHNICLNTTGENDDVEGSQKYHYLIHWMAYAVQHPDEQGHAAIVVQGLKGVGKNVFAEGFMNLFGRHGKVFGDNRDATGNFNARLMDTCVAVLDESFFVGSKKDEQTLKHLITGTTLRIEKKGIDAFEVPNLLHIIMLGNAEWLTTSVDRRTTLFYADLRCG